MHLYVGRSCNLLSALHFPLLLVQLFSWHPRWNLSWGSCWGICRLNISNIPIPAVALQLLPELAPVSFAAASADVLAATKEVLPNPSSASTKGIPAVGAFPLWVVAIISRIFELHVIQNRIFPPRCLGILAQASKQLGYMLSPMLQVYYL